VTLVKVIKKGISASKVLTPIAEAIRAVKSLKAI
jgi:hypothetical protein